MAVGTVATATAYTVAIVSTAAASAADAAVVFDVPAAALVRSSVAVCLSVCLSVCFSFICCCLCCWLFLTVLLLREVVVERWSLVSDAIFLRV